ncbi:putative zinc finger CCCH domain-containing protein 9 [Brassica napus]|uniref:putative zinc finger CCCH domain-containing protein 9 n=1 Tax=Brassica napus TaxID=3708 RepID=UPI0020788AD3|nr:putative zinc finger CCCH domain-containing protein 9 [Brassica napus]
MSDRENPEKGDEEAKETDTRTESTSMEETEGRDPDSGPSESNVRTDRRHERYPRSRAAKRENEPERHGLGESSEYPVRIGVEDCYYYMKKGRCGYGLSCRFNHPPLPQRDQMRHDMVQPSRYPVRPQLPERSQMRHDMVQTSPYPGAGDCIQYLQTGKCSYGPKCRFNHPPSPRVIGAIDCRQYLQTGQCSYGPKCRYNHPPSPVLPQWVSRQICKFFQKGDCKNGSGCKFTHSMSGDGAEAEPMRQDTSWGKKRHAAKSSSRPWKRERQAHDLEERKQKKRRVENLRIDPNVQSGEGGSQTEQRLEVPENRNVNAQEQADMERQNREAQEKAQEERRLRIDNERRQARLRLERMQPRVLTNNVDQLREALPDIGIERKEGDGF